MKAIAAAALLFAGSGIHEACATGMESTEAASLGMAIKAKLKSPEEIDAAMSVSQAADLVSKLSGVKETPALLTLIRERIAGGQTLRGRGRGAGALAAGTTPSPKGTAGEAPKGYEALAPAAKMINSMIQEAREKLDSSQITCGRFERNQIVLMQEATRDVSAFNGQAAEARGEVLRCQSIIGRLSEQIPEVKGQLSEHRRDCISQITTLKMQINVVTSDLGIVKKILGMLKCKGEAVQGFLQTDTQNDPEDDDDLNLGMDQHSLVECEHCQDGQGLVMLQSAEVQPLLNSLQSDIARGWVQEQLKSIARNQARDSESDEAPVALTQEQVRRMTAIMHADPTTEEKKDEKEDDDLRQEPEPAPPQPVNCAPTSACKLTKGSCNRLKDRFLLVKGGIEDRLDELTTRLRKLEHYCEQTDASLVGQLASMSDRLREAQTCLAESTKDQIDSENQAAQRGRQHSALKKEYTSTLTQCCADQNEARSEICALVKIRGELYKIEGAKIFIVDCAVSDWVVSECSKTCGKGTRSMRRSITVAPSGGAACPPLQATEECNPQPCPVDCKMGMWSGWSGCTARCGGGVRSRSRHIKVPPRHGGEPCERTEETEACNMQSCNRNCVLGRWNDWSACSRACSYGIAVRSRRVKAPAMGTGRCPSPTSRARRHTRWCNGTPCYRMVPRGRRYLQCNSKLDIILLLDSSGSLGSYGWAQFKKFAGLLVEAFMAEQKADVNVALLEFSSSYNTKWITHLPEGTTKEKVDTMKWLASGTATHMALDMAEAELTNGRADVPSVVMVITDGRPSSVRRTYYAARSLQKKARVIWLAMGPRAPMRTFYKMAAKPVRDHVLKISRFQWMTHRIGFNNIIGATCPEVK